MFRLWFENNGVFTGKQKTALASVSLARIICDNTGILTVPSDPFRFQSSTSFVNCGNIPAFDLDPWKETGEASELLTAACLYINLLHLTANLCLNFLTALYVLVEYLNLVV